MTTLRSSSQVRQDVWPTLSQDALQEIRPSMIICESFEDESSWSLIRNQASFTKPLSFVSGRQTPRLLTPCSDDVFDDENDDDISTELTEPETTPWLFRPIAPAEDTADYDLTEHDTFENDEDDSWSPYISGVPMEIEVLDQDRISCFSNNRYSIEDMKEEADYNEIILALRSRNDILIDNNNESWR